MIQRIQTVFLLLAIVSLGLFLWLPLIRFQDISGSRDITGWQVSHLFNGYIYFINAILTATAIGLSLINIFLFKNRSLQALLCWFAIIFIAAGGGYVFYEYHSWPCGYNVFIHTIINCDVYFRKWNILPVLAIVFEILAFVYIRKDEALIESMDRLR